MFSARCFQAGLILALFGCCAKLAYADPQTPVESLHPENHINQRWQEACSNCFSLTESSLSRGTIFLWSSHPDATGGPDLEAPLVTDRPDFTEASVTVGQGVAQIEVGYTFTSDDNGFESVSSHSFGEALLRYGILEDWLEFRIAVFPVQELTVFQGTSNSTAGHEDLYTGLKIALTPQAGFLPEMALIPQMNLPTGSRSFTTDKVEPGLNWIYSWEINDFISTAGSTQANRRIDVPSGAPYLELAQSWTVAYSLSDQWGAYTEWFALIPSGAVNVNTQHYFNGGFTWLINNDLQLDVRAGVGLNRAADNYFVGTGLSIRFP